MTETKKSSKRKKILITFGIILLVLCISLFVLLNKQVFNWGAPAGLPEFGTLLPIFSNSNEGQAILPYTVPKNTVTKLPDPSSAQWQLIVGGLDQPVEVAHALDGTTRLFVVEKPGIIRIIQNQQTDPQPFLDIRDRVGDGAYEQGLLGLVFHPEYAVNGYFFVNYTDNSGGTVIARYQVSADPNLADPNSESRLFQIKQPFANHNAGALAFGPDGYLYIGLGDGGAAGDPDGNGHNVTTLLGTILRVDVDSTTQPYSVPVDNPFDENSGLPEIWLYGLRNPWRMTFDPLSGDLYIADVGQNTWEEVNFIPEGTPGGLNLGWDYREGFHVFGDQVIGDVAFYDPVAEYQHKGNGCSVTGGVVYRGEALP
ncbi:MAG: PQQ-dependent sugar dehydrogenase, partial [Chloroflexota bacterium]